MKLRAKRFGRRGPALPGDDIVQLAQREELSGDTARTPNGQSYGRALCGGCAFYAQGSQSFWGSPFLAHVQIHLFLILERFSTFFFFWGGVFVESFYHCFFGHGRKLRDAHANQASSGRFTTFCLFSRESNNMSS